MSSQEATGNRIHVKGAREHNLRNLELHIPRDKLVVVTGVSGSGKSSLAFDTLYAEGYRKYIESLSVRARQLLEEVRRPDVDFIHGLSPVIAIEQRTGSGANPRSTLASVTEIADYARLLWTVAGKQFDPIDGAPIERSSLDDCIRRVLGEPEGSRLMLLAPSLTAKAAVLREELPRIRQRGYQRIRINGSIRELGEPDLIPVGGGEHKVEIVIDRLVLDSGQRSRIADSLELAFREGGDRALLLVQTQPQEPWREIPLSQSFAGVRSGVVYDKLTPRHLSWNHPEGACPSCGGLGRTLQFQSGLVVPDPSKSVKNGAIKPWRIGSKAMIIRRNAILKQLAEQLPYDPDTPWRDLPEAVRETLLFGAGERLFAFKLKGGNRKPEMLPFAGVIADLEDSRSNSRSDSLRTRLSAYQTGSSCPECAGTRLNARARRVTLNNCPISDFLHFTVERALEFIVQLKAADQGLYQTVQDAVQGLHERLYFLSEVGLTYLGLDREYATLSGGEAQRARLATQLGMGLVGVCYVLDEPSIGLHPADNRRLIRSLLDLRDRGNAVIVVEHDGDTLRAADHLIELGPGAGAMGGDIVFQGSPAAAVDDRRSLSGAYLGGRIRLQRNGPAGRPGKAVIEIIGAAEHNLRDLDVRFPVGLLTAICGVSGSGKSSLVNHILGQAAAFRLNGAKAIPGRHRAINGLEHFRTVVRVDQSPIGRTPRSNPATYTKLFDLLRALYAKCPLAKIRGYKASRFSFNTRGGRCEKCLGDGQIRLDMQFLGDVFVECPSCRGARYNRETLEVRFKGHSIADVLNMTVCDALEVFRNQPRIHEKLTTLAEVGLGYVKLGQPANTLSGGEAQRIKLSTELSRRQQGDTLYLLDEPSTGLHWADVQKLLDLLFRLRDAGNTLLVIEHHPDIIRLADWVVELGPGGGEHGGQLVFSGTPEALMKTLDSPTAQAIGVGHEV